MEFHECPDNESKLCLKEPQWVRKKKTEEKRSNVTNVVTQLIHDFRAFIRRPPTSKYLETRHH